MLLGGWFHRRKAAGHDDAFVGFAIDEEEDCRQALIGVFAVEDVPLTDGIVGVVEAAAGPDPRTVIVLDAHARSPQRRVDAALLPVGIEAGRGRVGCATTDTRVAGHESVTAVTAAASVKPGPGTQSKSPPLMGVSVAVK